MSTFLGSYTHTLDEKGRVSLPAPFRREAEDQRFVLIQVHEPSLALYPESAWRDVEARLRNLMRDDPDARMWVASVLSKGVEVSPDSQGRILIPSKLQEAARLDGQVHMVGMVDKVELWNPSDFDAVMMEQEGKFKGLAGQIFR